MDRVELEASQITGNRELPRVLYIVPWKRSDLGDLTGKAKALNIENASSLRRQELIDIAGQRGYGDINYEYVLTARGAEAGGGGGRLAIDSQPGSGTRLAARAVWDFVEFILNSLVFILIGLQLNQILGRLDGRYARHFGASTAS